MAFTIAAEIGEIERFSTPEKLTGYTGLCPRVVQSGDSDRRGPLSKHGPTYLRCSTRKHPARPSAISAPSAAGKQRGAKVAQIDIARHLCHAIWHMLTRNETFAPEAPLFVWRPDRPSDRDETWSFRPPAISPRASLYGSPSEWAVMGRQGIWAAQTRLGTRGSRCTAPLARALIWTRAPIAQLDRATPS